MTTRTKLFWVAILYFAEGFPFGLVYDAFPVYFRFHGVSLTEIGLLSLVGLPWTIKFLWAPLVDLWGSRRNWFLVCQMFLTAALLAVQLLAPGRIGLPVWILLFSLTVFSATQDTAIDAYTIELLDTDEMGPANGIRVTTYRVALISAGGLFVALAGVVGWKGAFLGAAVVMALAAAACSRSPRLPKVRTESAPRAAGTNPLVQAIWEPLKPFLDRPGFLAIIFFVLLFKLGDMAMGPMIKPFWVDRHFTPIEIGVVPGTVGVVSTIVGALLGGELTARWGIFKGLWLLGIAQAVSNLYYAGVAALPTSAALMYSASVVESFCGGLGTAPFLAFLMSICDKEHAATQYALLSALFGLTRSLSGAFSGVAAQHLGYSTYFTVTFFLAWPAFALLPWVHKWIGDDAGKPVPAAAPPLETET